MKDAAKAVKFCGSALDDLRAFPSSARRDAGYELDKVQRGRDPGDWKPMTTVGAGVREIRIRDASGAFRVLYVAKFAETVYVCCTVFRRRRRQPAKSISSWPRNDIGIW